MREFTVSENDAGQRLDKFVVKSAKNMPLSLVYKFIRTKKIKVNRKRAENNQILQYGDVVLMFVPEDMFAFGITKNELLHAPDMPFIVYEDANLILCNKPVGMLSHSGDIDGGGTDERGTLVYAVRAYLCRKGEYDPSVENTFAPALANRIDRNTSGIVIAAKNAASLRELNNIIRERQIDKYYLCAIHGKMQKDSAVLQAYHFKDNAKNTVKITQNEIFGSKQIITEYKVVDYNVPKDLSLLEVKLHTGRTHQIRAHMEFTGHPLLGETKYGAQKSDFGTSFNSQALCSYRVTFMKNDGMLAYLYKKSFSLQTDDIGFLKLFNTNRIAEFLNSSNASL